MGYFWVGPLHGLTSLANVSRRRQGRIFRSTRLKSQFKCWSNPEIDQDSRLYVVTGISYVNYGVNAHFLVVDNPPLPLSPYTAPLPLSWILSTSNFTHISILTSIRTALKQFTQVNFDCNILSTILADETCATSM